MLARLCVGGRAQLINGCWYVIECTLDLYRPEGRKLLVVYTETGRKLLAVYKEAERKLLAVYKEAERKLLAVYTETGTNSLFKFQFVSSLYL